jgi:glycosyltransferase involved in cell wall biosynthesis
VSTLFKVAICQTGIIPGGRLRVILGIVDILNDADIVPDILTTRLAISPQQIADKYGRSLRANYRVLPRPPKVPKDFVTIMFNAALGHYAADHDLIINTSNSLFLLPRRKKVITYMFFPRKRRIMADVVSIHRPDWHLRRGSLAWLARMLLRMLYRLSNPQPHHEIVCLSDFTRSALEQVYQVPEGLPVIYPPVDMTAFQTERGARSRAVVTVGRFGSSKRQLEQIKLAERLPDIPFHIIGFAKNVDYYRACERYVEAHQLSNVYLYPDAPFSDMLKLLQGSKYFLHTLINEPFGITAVQAMAAGCVPIVHDSGGQRETVPEPTLRYKNLEQVPDILAGLESQSVAQLDALSRRLQQYALAQFDTKVFKSRMGAVLAPYL